MTGPLRPRFVSAIAELIARERASGEYQPPEDPELLADSLLSLVERFLYHGGDPAMAPEPATARRVVALLLREKCSNDCCANLNAPVRG